MRAELGVIDIHALGAAGHIIALSAYVCLVGIGADYNIGSGNCSPVPVRFETKRTFALGQMRARESHHWVIVTVIADEIHCRKTEKLLDVAGG